MLAYEYELLLERLGAAARGTDRIFRLRRHGRIAQPHASLGR